MTKPMFIGIAGRAGSGKDPAADVIRGFLPGPSVTIALATGLKNMLAVHYGLQAGGSQAYKLMYTAEGKKQPSPNPLKPGNTVRDDLIQLGDATRGIYEDVWVEDCIRRGEESGAEYVLVPDVRYQNERQRMDLVIWMGPDDKGAHPTESALTSDCTSEAFQFMQGTVVERLAELRKFAKDYFTPGTKSATYYKRTGAWPEPPSSKTTLGQSPYDRDRMEKVQSRADEIQGIPVENPLKGKTVRVETMDTCSGCPGEIKTVQIYDAEDVSITAEPPAEQSVAVYTAYTKGEFLELTTGNVYFTSRGSGCIQEYQVQELADEMTRISSPDRKENALDIATAEMQVLARREIYEEVDGYYVWAPTKGQLYSCGTMHTIAAKLKYLNTPWDTQVKTDPTLG